MNISFCSQPSPDGSAFPPGFDHIPSVSWDFFRTPLGQRVRKLIDELTRHPPYAELQRQIDSIFYKIGDELRQALPDENVHGQCMNLLHHRMPLVPDLDSLILSYRHVTPIALMARPRLIARGVDNEAPPASPFTQLADRVRERADEFFALT